jgi:hypothetical protein
MPVLISEHFRFGTPPNILSIGFQNSIEYLRLRSNLPHYRNLIDDCKLRIPN